MPKRTWKYASQRAGAISDAEWRALQTANTPTGKRGGYANVNPRWILLMMEQIPKSIRMSDALTIANKVWREVNKWVQSYEDREARKGEGWAEFRRDWIVYRLFVPLQIRLCVEQVLWNKGSPWNSLCTGFKAVGQK